MDDVWLQALFSVALGVGIAAATGLRVFLPLLVLGCAARLGWVPLVGNFEWVASDPGLGVLTAATLVEITAYYFPWLDNLLDLMAGPLAIGAGVLAFVAVTSDLPPPLRWAMGIVAGGGTAGLVQALTTMARLKSTAFTAGLANPVLATFEWGGALVLSLVAIAVPIAAVVLLIALVVGVGRVGRRVLTRRPQ